MTSATRRSFGLKVIDLFCGVGGLSYGFEMLDGFNVVAAIDINHSAIATYSANYSIQASEEDVTKDELLSRITRPDVIIGGPPCQGFSSAGLRKTGDVRNSLVGRFAEIIALLRPSAFVFENVEGFLTMEDGDRIFDLLNPLVDAGYRIHLRKINAANYGVPQHRKRVIAIGGLGWTPSFPEFSHSAFGAPGAHLATQVLPLAPTLSQVLAGLPEPADKAPGTLQGHVARKLTGDDLVRAHLLAPGQSMRDLPEELQHPSFRRRAFRRVVDGTPTEKRGGAPSGVRRLRPDEPCKAITGAAVNEFLHPKHHRTLTLRECARLQTFPDDFIFIGSPQTQAQLIGNAVPPLLSVAIAASLKDDFERGLYEDSANSGALVSYVPTLSTGYSPILKRVTDRIMEKFMYSVQQIGNPMNISEEQLTLCL